MVIESGLASIKLLTMTSAYVVHTGKSPDGGFYLSTPSCATDPDIDVPGDELAAQP